METPSLRLFNMKFKNVNVKDAPENFLIWLSEVKLPKSNYLNKSVRGKTLAACSLDVLEYIGWSCKNCNPLLKKQAKFLYYIRLYPKISELEIDEQDFNELVIEDLGSQHIGEVKH